MMPDSHTFLERQKTMIPVDQHSLKLQLLNEKVNSLLNHDPNKLALKDTLTFNFDRPQDLLASHTFSLLLKPASALETLEDLEGQYVAFSPDNKLLASASGYCSVRLWNIPSGQLNAELEGHEGKVYSVGFSPDAQSIVTGSDDKTVRTWSIATKQQVQVLDDHSDAVYSVAWSPNGALIASGSIDTTVILWDAISGSATKTLTDHTNEVLSVSFSQNGNKLVSAGGRHAIIWDVHSGAALIKLDHSDYAFSVCFSPDDQFVVTGCGDAIVRMFNANTGHEEKRFEGHTSRINSVACSFDGSMIVSSGGSIFENSDNSVRLWDVASTKQLPQLDRHPDYVNSVAFSRDGKFIASASDDNTVCLWNAPSLFQIPYQPKEDEEEEEAESRKRQKIDHK